MAPSQASRKTELQSLIELTRTSSSLITHYLSTISSPSTSTNSTSNITDPPNPLHVLKDAALLLKSHTTKLGLLLLNPPFTPTAISSILRAMTTTCLPALLSAVELAPSNIWGRLLRTEVDVRVTAVLRAVEACLADVRATATAEEGDAAARPKKDTLAATGVVWEACDALVELEELDVGGLALRKAKAYQALLRDALEELKEWREESTADDGDEDDEEEDEDKDEDEDYGLGSAGKLPRDRPELLLALDDALVKIKRVDFLYTALAKRRVATFTKDKARIRDHVRTMDEVLDEFKTMSETTDELASAFYELDEEGIEEHKNTLVEEARKTIKLVRVSWDGTEDEFTAWSSKWLEVMK
ncbi:hypothetical protein ANO11243_085760 [Dothideomycetidae sp. 11243]|nr:hypothetical protein ANO11243_085760 [fungal sp. No.11243]